MLSRLAGTYFFGKEGKNTYSIIFEGSKYEGPDPQKIQINASFCCHCMNLLGIIQTFYKDMVVTEPPFF